MYNINDVVSQLQDVLDQDEVSLDCALACGAEDDCPAEYEEDAAREFLGDVVVTLSQLAPYQMSPQAVAELVNAAPDRFTLYKWEGDFPRPRLVLDGACRKVVDIGGWPSSLVETLKCKTVNEERCSWEEPIAQEDIDALLLEALGKAQEAREEGSFTLHWKNGDEVEMGQRFRALSVVGTRPSDVLTVDSVTLCDGSPRAYVYCKDTGYPIDSCEPVRDAPSDTCYNLNGNDLRGFLCSKCRKGVAIKEPVYCPNCGRRVL